jgi:sugar phosphate isomerase/epimerase
VDPRRPEQGRERRLAAIRQIVEGYRYGVSICLDVGHQAYESGDPLAFLAQHGERVREVHLHDSVSVSAGPRPQIRDHLPLGRGEMDYLAFLRRLEQMGFEGAVILENNTQADVEGSLERVRSFL